jgi:hypothetical protein
MTPDYHITTKESGKVTNSDIIEKVMPQGMHIPYMKTQNSSSL